MDPFKREHYETSKRPPLLRGYLEMQISNLRRKHPNCPPNIIENFVKRTTTERMENPIVDVVVHPEQGRSDRKKIGLVEHCNINLKQNIIAPSGSCYMLPTVKESFLKVSIDSKLKERKVYKGIMLSAKEKGDMIKENTYNLLQSSTKIFVNSAPGAMNSRFNILYDKPGFNSITSISRHSVKTGYAHTERMVGANLYLPYLEDVKAYCLRLASVMPKETAEVISKFKLHIPSVEEVTQYLASNHHRYTLHKSTLEIRQYLLRFTDIERTFILYGGCLKNLLEFNDSLFKRFLTKLFDQNVEHASVSLDDRKKIEGTLMAMITSVNYEILGQEADGKYRNLDEACQDNPDGAKHIIGIAKHMERLFDIFHDVFATFIRVEADFANTGDYHNLIRKVVIISDTDSVIFTTQELVKWRCGSYSFAKEGYQMNAFVVYVVSRSLEHVFARLSCGFGMIGKDIFRIAMKNEFMYPAMMHTSICKHYLGIIQIQEGKLLLSLTDDVKGLGFRTSVLSKDTIRESTEFNINLLKTVMREGEISLTEELTKVADFERRLYDSLMSGDRDYLQLMTIKTNENYDDPQKSPYFYYEFWEEVFAESYDHMVIPSKNYKLPLIGKGKILKDPAFLALLEEKDPQLKKRLLKYLEANPRTPSMILVPSTMPTIPELLRQTIDIRGIINSNAQPMYLGINGLGVAFNYKAGKYLISDYFNPYGISVPFS